LSRSFNSRVDLYANDWKQAKNMRQSGETIRLL
jgi:hypothetical protein